ncbi:hypothetical protein [Saccharopolyspora hattusasensis]|uniref:hypothetical protein n=1 Tax=Saccharopolyspora hattusasensis TaxID=1128679 RepID=UPI003D97373A
MKDNYGINISGSGSFNADAVAVGIGAQAVSAGGSQELRDLQEQVRELLAALRTARNGGEIDSDDVVADAEQLEEEINNDSPDKSRILGLLRNISSTVTQVGDLATAVQNAQDAVGSLLS